MSSRLTRRELLGHVLGWGAGLSVLGAGTATAQAYAPARLTRLTTTLPGLNTPLRVAALSDLHYGPYIGERQLAGWVDLTLSAQPDLIVVLGDFCDVRLADGLPEPLLRQLGRLRAPLGVWGVWGNHDYGSFGHMYQRFTGPARADWAEARRSFQSALADVGLTILTNRGALVRPDLWLGGLDDRSQGHPDPQAALGPAPRQAARLLMVHEPDDLMDLAAVPAWTPGGLALCGHTHGGQIRLPLLGALAVPSGYGQRFAQGWVQGEPHGGKAAARGYVSRGLGLSGLPFRNLCPPEVVLFDLQLD